MLIDDLQWLDVASAEAIVFAARRLADSRAAFLFAVRDGERVPADITGISVIVAERLDRAATATLASRVRGTPVTTEARGTHLRSHWWQPTGDRRAL